MHDTFQFHSEPLQDHWLDAYGHLNEACYLVPLSNCTWRLQEHFGIGIDYFERTGCALYTVETHLRYLKEVRKPAMIRVESMILGSDAKKIWFAHLMRVDGEIRATGEFMAVHYSAREQRVIEMPDAVRQKLRDAQVADPPAWVGGRISLIKA